MSQKTTPDIPRWRTTWVGALTEVEQEVMADVVRSFIELFEPEGEGRLTIIVGTAEDIAARPDFGGAHGSEYPEVVASLGGPGRRALVVIAEDDTGVPVVEVWDVARQLEEALGG